MLGSRRLRDGQIVDNITGDAAGVGDQELHNLEADRVTQGFKHRNKPILVDAGNVECTTRLGKYFICSHNCFIVILR